MLIRKPKPRRCCRYEPIKHRDAHKRPLTRRDFIAQGFLAGAATVMAPTIAQPVRESARRRPPRCRRTSVRPHGCRLRRRLVGTQDSFHLHRPRGRREHGGSNVLAGGQRGQLDFLSTRATPNRACRATWCPSLAESDGTSLPFIEYEPRARVPLGQRVRARHHRAGVRSTAPSINGAVIPARSENDTGNNPHNPMYGIASRGRGRRAPDAHRLAGLGLRRQLDGAGDHDRR